MLASAMLGPELGGDVLNDGNMSGSKEVIICDKKLERVKRQSTLLKKIVWLCAQRLDKGSTAGLHSSSRSLIQLTEVS